MSHTNTNFCDIPFRFAFPSSWTVHVGITDQPVTGGMAYTVKKIMHHKKYRPKSLHYDIALMKLTTSIIFDGKSSYSIILNVLV